MKTISNLSAPSLVEHIGPLFDSAEQVDIAVGFAGASGLEGLRAGIESLLSRQGTLRLIVGMLVPAGATRRDLDSLTNLNSAPGSLQHRRVRVTTRSYHGKLYLFKTSDTVESIVGSSNMTAGGLRDNLEFNLCFEGLRAEESIALCTNFFERLWSPDYSLPFRAVDYRVRRNLEGMLRRAGDLLGPEQPRNVAVEGLEPPIVLTVSQANLRAYGDRPGRSGREAYLNVRSVHSYFPRKGTIFRVVTDVSGFEFDAKVSGGEYAGDPLPKNLESAGDLEPLYAWLVDQHGAQPGDRVRIQRLDTDLYYFEFLR